MGSLLLSILPTPLLTLSSLKDLYLSLTLLSLSLTPTTIPLSSTTSLHLYHPLHPSSSKPSLLLLHGFGANSRWQFQHQLPHLSSSFNLYLPDLLHFGRSNSANESFTVAFQAECMVRAMRAMGVERYDVAGISYGGFVGYKVAEMAGEGVVGRVVVLTAGVAAGEEERREMERREGRDVAEVLLPRNAEDLRTLVRRSVFKPSWWIPDFLLNDFIRLMYRDRREERVELLKDLMLNGIGVDPLPILKQETLLLWGDKDTVFPVDLAYKLQRHLGPKARLNIIKDAGHALQLEKPDIVNNMIESFLLEPYQNTST